MEALLYLTRFPSVWQTDGIPEGGSADSGHRHGTLLQRGAHFTGHRADVPGGRSVSDRGHDVLHAGRGDGHDAHG